MTAPNTYYKVIRNGQSFHGGSHTWSLPQADGTPGDWHKHPCKPLLFSEGFHLTQRPDEWFGRNATVYIVEFRGEVDGPLNGDCDPTKIAVQEVRLLRALTNEELAQFGIYFEGKHECKRPGRRSYAFGTSEVTAWGSSEIIAFDSSSVKAFERCRVQAYGNSKITAHDYVEVVCLGSSQVLASGYGVVQAYDKSTVNAHGKYTVRAYCQSVIHAYGSCYVESHDESVIDATHETVVSVHSGFAKVSLDQFAVEVNRTKGGVTLYGVDPAKPAPTTEAKS